MPLAIPSSRPFDRTPTTQPNTQKTDGEYDAKTDWVMLLFRVSDGTVDGQKEGEFARPMARSPGPNEGQEGDRAAITAFPPMTIAEGPQQDGPGRPAVSGANAILQIPSLRKRARLSGAADQ